MPVTSLEVFEERLRASVEAGKLTESQARVEFEKRRAGPSFFEKVGHFATSAVKHVAAGAPRCTDEQVAARHAICSTCEYFDGKACTKCGCPVSRERAYISKLSWAGESCPVGKWGPVPSVG